MRLFSSFEISGSGLTAQRLRMDVIANNIANVNTTRTANGEPYQRAHVVFETVLNQQAQAAGGLDGTPAGVRVSRIEHDQCECRDRCSIP